MIISLLVILAAFYWLLRETDYLRVRFLAYGDIDYGKLWIDTFVPLCGLQTLQNGLTEHEPISSYHEPPTGYVIRECLKGTAKTNGHYEILVSPGINELLCGKAWVEEHWNDLKDYKPEIFVNMGGVRYNMTINKPEVIKDIMKANKISRAQKKAYSTI